MRGGGVVGAGGRGGSALSSQEREGAAGVGAGFARPSGRRGRRRSRQALVLALVGWLGGVASVLAQRPPLPAAATPAQVSPAILVLRGGGKDERPRAVESLMAAVSRRSAVETDTGAIARVGPLDGALFDHPLVFLSGATPFEPLSDKELDAMRTFLSSGGMVVVDDRSGQRDSEFARRARSELSRALGGRPFEPLRHDHALYRSFYLLDQAWGRVDVDAELSGIVINNRVAVLFSANDVMGAWERDELGGWARSVEPGGTRQREMAIRLGVNVVLYALTLDYKEDLVHLPLILERGDRGR